ncbi:glutamate--cysteine ligase [bacterium]|nr:glutamate--cysteine ligase [bacterium]
MTTRTLMQQIRQLVDERGEELEGWFAERAKETPYLFTNSVDVRYSGDKLVPVDTNLYPAGFNNLTGRSRLKAVEAIARQFPTPQKLLILPEEHTRNLKYLDSLAILADLLSKAGHEVVIGQLDLESRESMALESASGMEIMQQPLKLEHKKLQTLDGFVPDQIILNNDFTSPPPNWIICLAQPVLPPATLGWYRRRKSEHFRAYNLLAEQFSSAFGMHAARLTSLYSVAEGVDFMEMTGLEPLALQVEALIQKLKEQYKAEGIAGDPFVFIKSDNGTYGMGIMTARSGEEVMSMNRKVRKKMHAIKGGVVNSTVVIQEGIPTIDRINNHVAEPMVYVLGGVPVGGAYRVHEDKDDRDSLNAVGMRFVPLCCEPGQRDIPEHCDFKVLGVISRLAALAVAREEYVHTEVACAANESVALSL